MNRLPDSTSGCPERRLEDVLAALDMTLEQLESRLRCGLAKRSLTHHDREDILQNVYLWLLKYPHHIVEAKYAGTVLDTILGCRCADYLSHRRSQVTVEFDDLQLGVETISRLGLDKALKQSKRWAKRDCHVWSGRLTKTAISRLRKHGQFSRLDVEPAVISTEPLGNREFEDLSCNPDYASVREAWRDFGIRYPRYQEVLQHRIILERSNRATAAILGISPEACRKLYARAVQKFAELYPELRDCLR